MKNDKNIKVFQSEKRVGLREITVFHGLEPTGKMNKAKGVGLLFLDQRLIHSIFSFCKIPR